MLLERRLSKEETLSQSEDLHLLREAVSHLEWTRLLADVISDRHAGNFYSNIVSVANRLAKETIN